MRGYGANAEYHNRVHRRMEQEEAMTAIDFVILFIVGLFFLWLISLAMHIVIDSCFPPHK